MSHEHFNPISPAEIADELHAASNELMLLAELFGVDPTETSYPLLQSSKARQGLFCVLQRIAEALDRAAERLTA